MRKIRKKMETPKNPYDKARLESETKIMGEYGLRRKRELWRAETELRSIRRQAKEIMIHEDEVKKKQVMDKLKRLGIIEKDAGLDDILRLSVRDILDRRLQTFLFRKSIANTPAQARQLITHGHITIGDSRIKYPSYIISKEEEKMLKCAVSPIQEEKKGG